MGCDISHKKCSVAEIANPSDGAGMILVAYVWPPASTAPKN